MEGRIFQGEGIHFDSGSLGDSQKPTKLFLEFDPKKGLRLRLKSEKNLELVSSEFSDNFWTRKEDLFIWKPNSKEEIYFQAMDRNRLHIHWKSSSEIYFSGTIGIRPKSILEKIFGFI